MIRFPPRRILVAVEFSKESLYAWQAAKEISARFGSSLEAVWCIEPLPTEMTGLRNLSRKSAYRVQGLRRMRERLGPDARVHAVEGAPSSALRKLARGRDLLVVGAHRLPALLRWAQGSVAEAIVHDAPCPVLVVPRAWRSPRRVLAPVRDAAYARRGLLAAAVVARAYGGRLTVLEVVPDAALRPDAAKRIKVQAETLPPALVRGVRPELEVRIGSPIKEILRACRSRDIIVLLAHRKSLLGDMVLGTTAERVLRHSRLPVLAIPSRGGRGVL